MLIVEKRFAKNSDLNLGNTNEMLSVALPHDVHANYTRQWRKLLQYGDKYSESDIIKAAAEVYKKDAELMGATLYTLAGKSLNFPI